MLRKISFCLVFLLFLGGCSKEKIPQVLWPKEESKYYQLSKKWTKEKVFYLGLDGSTQVMVLYKSAEWLEGFSEFWAKTYLLSSAEKEAFTERLLAENRDYFSFVVGLSSSIEDVDRLKLPSSLWSLFLVQKGIKTYPLEIRPLEWPRAKIEIFYPLSEPWQNLYEVKFEKKEEHFEQLVLAGPQGQALFTW
jgi:hypothetical protein